MNEFYADATCNFRRAAALLAPGIPNSELEDVLIYFAFGIERIFKAILFDINPTFILEADSFDNAVGVMYRDKLVEPHRAKADKEAHKFNTNLLPFKASMLRAARFSRTIEENIGAFTKLSDFRGIVAHRPLSQLKREEASRFVLRLFHPILESLEKEGRISVKACCASATIDLAGISRQIVEEDNLKDRIEKQLELHRAEWEKRKSDQKLIDKATRETEAAYKTDGYSERSGIEYECPACGNRAILWLEADWDVEGSRGEGWITGIYVSGLECKYCGLHLDDYEEFDYLKLNDALADG